MAFGQGRRRPLRPARGALPCHQVDGGRDARVRVPVAHIAEAAQVSRMTVYRVLDDTAAALRGRPAVVH